MQAEVALRERGEEVSRPYDADAMHELVGQHRRGAARAIGLWLVSAEPGPAEAWLVLKSIAATRFLGPLLDLVPTYSQRLSAKARLSLVMAGLGVTLTRGASPEFLEASGINTVDEKTVGEELLKAGENAKNNKQRRHVLEIWKTFAPKSESLRRKFVRRVMIPYARSNKEALRQVVNHLELALPLPRGVRQPFVAALREEGKAAGIRDRVDEKLLEVGLLERVGRIRKRLVEGKDE